MSSKMQFKRTSINTPITNIDFAEPIVTDIAGDLSLYLGNAGNNPIEFSSRNKINAELDKKQNLIPNAVANNIVLTNANGQVIDSGVGISNSTQISVVASPQIQNALLGSVLTVDNLKVRYNSNSIGGNLDIACVSGTLPYQKIVARKFFDGGFDYKRYYSKDIGDLTTTFTAFQLGGSGGISSDVEDIQYDVYISNTERYKIEITLTGTLNTDLLRIELTQITQTN